MRDRCFFELRCRRSGRLLYAALNLLWNAQMIPSCYAGCVLHCWVWYLRAGGNTSNPLCHWEASNVFHKKPHQHRAVYTDSNVPKQPFPTHPYYPRHTNTTQQNMRQQVHFCHCSGKGNRGSDGCLGDRPISPWTQSNHSGFVGHKYSET